ncbi:hypothetical protein [Paenibacillus sp. FSL H7-0714]|uniref:hypothetical protein n=1 Tax=Paenibacillus sp. FSL H7-0714 TaxID=2954735 RepID=UPI0030FAE105
MDEVKKQHHFGNLHERDFVWLIEQAEILKKIEKRWIEIETNGTKEEADDFYTFVQETLANSQAAE